MSIFKEPKPIVGDSEDAIYARSLSKKQDFYDLIHFKDKHVLCGSFFENYGLFTVTDYTDRTDSHYEYDHLPTTKELFDEHMEYSKSCIYTFPNAIQKYIAKNISNKCELTDEELSDVLDFMKIDKTFINEYNNNLEKEKEEILKHISHIATVEHPISVSLHGNDDLSFGKTFKTMEEAYSIYEMLIKFGDEYDFYKLMEMCKLNAIE